MNKKTIIIFALAIAAAAVHARPHCGHPPRGGHHHFRHHAHHHHHHHHGAWGRGGRHFWPGFVGGVVGGVVGGTLIDGVVGPRVVAAPTTIVTTPTVVTPTVVAPTVVTVPATQTQNVWVEGRYVDQVQANGTVVRVWQPGHYEQRTVVVQ